MVTAPAQAPWWRDGRTYLLLLLTLLTLTAGWMHKGRCHEKDWDGYQWGEYCYSDVQALYGSRGAGDGLWPYAETPNEYPPVTGLFMHAMGEMTSSRDGYLLATALGLGALALVVTVLLGELVGRDRKVLYWALAPGLAIYFAYNWDLLAIAPAVGALLAFRKGHMTKAGILLGIGASAKLYPAFLAPALGVWMLREDGGLKRRGWGFGLGFAAAWLAFHLPFFLLDPNEMVATYRFHAERNANFESMWFALGHLGRQYDVAWLDWFDNPEVIDWVSLVPFAASLGFSGWAAWTRRLDPVAAACIPVFVFLTVNKVFSVQYTLWALPLLVVLHAPRVLKALLVVADLAVFLALFAYFGVSDGVTFTPVAFFVLLRAGTYTALTVWLVRQALAGPSEVRPPRPPAVEPARPPPTPRAVRP